VLQKAGQLVLVVQPRVEMLTHWQGMSVAEAVVQPFVVGVIESLLQQGPFQVPVDLGQEAEVRNPLAHAPDRLRPEGPGLDAPGPYDWERNRAAAASRADGGARAGGPERRLLRDRYAPHSA